MHMDMARDISYATAASGPAGAFVIRGLENATGRLSLIRRAAGCQAAIAQGRSFWNVVPECYGLSLQVIGGSLAAIPGQGPLVVIANHPFGILDGLMLGHLLHRMRREFRILANAVFCKDEALNRVVLPISFDETPEATRLNLETRAQSLRYLAQGGAIGVFPGGTVSTAARPFAQPMDPVWRTFTARMIVRTEATVVPLFFAGQNSRLFQIASHVHPALRLGLLIREFRRRIDTPVQVVIGRPIPAADLGALRRDPAGLMEFLRRTTYDLSPDPIGSYDPGHEFMAKYKTR